MPIRQRVSDKSHSDDIYIRRALTMAKRDQTSKLNNAKEWGDTEFAMRREHEYLTWINQQLATDSKLSIVAD
jgi:hypothetical protein